MAENPDHEIPGRESSGHPHHPGMPRTSSRFATLGNPRNPQHCG